MKKLATKLLVCSLACSLIVNPVSASALSSADLDKLLSEMDTTEEKVSSVSVELGTADLENIIEKRIEKAVANSVDKSVEKSIEKAALKVARDKKSVKNFVDASKKTSKGSILLKPFSAVWNVVKSAIVLALAVALPVGGIYAFAPSSRDAIETDLNNLLDTLKKSNSAIKVSDLYKVAVEKLSNIFSQTNVSDGQGHPGMTNDNEEQQNDKNEDE